MSGTPSDIWLERVFHATGRDDLVRLYDGWAENYDSDMQSTGYVHPPVLAGLVGRHVRDLDDAILDAGAGTGMLGGVLAILGYRNLIGVDMSDAMLAKANARGVYRDLRNRVLGEPLDFADGEVAAVVSSGVCTSGHGPAIAWDELARITRPGGHLISTFTTMVWHDQGFAGKFAELTGKGLIAEVEVTPVYHPLPFSLTESHLTARAHVYRKL
jgi:SAM-dependent methyltransferase